MRQQESLYPSYAPHQVTYSEPISTSYPYSPQQDPSSSSTNPFVTTSQTFVSTHLNTTGSILNGFLGSANAFQLEYKKNEKFGSNYRKMIISNCDVNNPFYDPQSCQSIMKCEPEFQENNLCFFQGVCTDSYVLSMSIVYTTNAERPMHTSLESGPTGQERQEMSNLIFSFKPYFWLTPTTEVKRTVEIFQDGISEREKIGYIEAGIDVTENARLINTLTREEFTTSKMESSGNLDPQVQMLDSQGRLVAYGKLLNDAMNTTNTLGSKISQMNHFQQFQFYLTAELVPANNPNRALLLVAFIFWVLDTQERLKRKWSMQLSLVVLFILVILLITSRM